MGPCLAIADPLLTALHASTNNVIILEEDLLIAPDFFSYFKAVSDTFQSRPSEAAGLLAVSAWNDNGQGRHVSDPQQLYRSDFFPGLGWMLTRSIWEELRDQWPAAYWDDWLREPARRRDRHIIRPEVSRTYHIGKRGVSNSEFGQVTYDIQPLIINTVHLLPIYILHPNN